MQVWEYRTLEISKSAEKELSQLGGQGWELVAVVEGYDEYSAVCYLKRPKR